MTTNTISRLMAAVCSLSIALSGPTVRGASLTWDIDPVTTGAQAGNGTWANGAGNWWDAIALVNANWDNATPDAASFGQSGLNNAANYTVTLGSDITAASLSRSGGTSGLAIIAPDAGGLYKLTLNGNFNAARGMQIDAPLVLAGGGTHSISGANRLIINGDITETGGANALALSFGPTLTLTGNNSFSGGVLGSQNSNNGKIELGTDTAVGTGPLRLGQDNIWRAINGNRTIANALTSGSVQGDWFVQFEDGEFDFTNSTALELGGNTGNTAKRYTFIVDNAKTTIAGGIDVGSANDNRRVGIIKDGAGTLVLGGTSKFEGDATHTEAITVRAGELILNGTVSSHQGTGQKSTLVESGGTLGGTGTLHIATGFALIIEDGGMLAPGNEAVGTFTVNGDVDFQESAVFAWEFENGVGDLVAVNGTLTLPNAATVSVTQVTGDLPAAPTLFSATTLAGATDLSGWTILDLENYQARIEGSDVILFAPPPPGSLFLLR